MTQDKHLKIVYCNPSLHIAGGIERVLSIKRIILLKCWDMKSMLS